MNKREYDVTPNWLVDTIGNSEKTARQGQAVGEPLGLLRSNSQAQGRLLFAGQIKFRRCHWQSIGRHSHRFLKDSGPGCPGGVPSVPISVPGGPAGVSGVPVVSRLVSRRGPAGVPARVLAGLPAGLSAGVPAGVPSGVSSWPRLCLGCPGSCPGWCLESSEIQRNMWGSKQYGVLANGWASTNCSC